MLIHDVTFSMPMMPMTTSSGWSVARNQYKYSLAGLKQLTQAPLTQDMDPGYAGVVAAYIAMYRYILGRDNQWHLLAYELNYGPYSMQAFHAELPGPVDQNTDPALPSLNHVLPTS